MKSLSALALAALALLSPNLDAAGTELRWTMLNVSPGKEQADCHLLRMPDGSDVLIDAADAADAPGTALALLQKFDVHHLSLVIISHFHRDHYGRLVDLLRAGIIVDRVILNVPTKESADLEIPWGCDLNDVESVLAELRLRKIPYSTPKAGDRLIELNPEPGITAGIDVLCCYNSSHTPLGLYHVNGSSIIVRVFYGPTRAMFTGDMPQALCSYLAETDLDLKADLVKVPHHGGLDSTSIEFYERVGATALLVPASRTIWESPLAIATRRYIHEHHIPVYVNGIDGNVTVIMTKDGYSIEKER